MLNSKFLRTFALSKGKDNNIINNIKTLTVYRLTASRIMNMDKFDWFKNEFFNNLSNDEQVEIFNKFCEENGYEDEIYPMCEFDEIFEGKKPSEVFQMTQTNMDDVDYNDNYFVVTIYGFKTFNDPYDFIQDYIGDIFDHMDIWETRISLDDYISDIYDAHIDLKPEDMDDDDFYEIVEDAVYSNDREKDIVNDIEKAVSEK